MQQLFLRANDERSRVGCEQQDLSTVPQHDLELRNQSWVVSNTDSLRERPDYCYSDTKSTKSPDVDRQKNSNQCTTSAKQFFKKNRLFNQSKVSILSLFDSSDVWKCVLQSFLTVLMGVRGSLVSIIEQRFNQVYHSSISQVVRVLVLGKATLEQGTISHLMKVTGTYHLFTISGFHLSLFLYFVGGLYQRYFSKNVVFYLNLFVSILFVSLVGLSPGIIRAFLMHLLYSLAWKNNRQKKALYILIISFLLQLNADIQALNSIGFQLSYIATCTIFLTYHITSGIELQLSFLTAYLPRVAKKHVSYVLNAFFISFFVQLSLLPLLLFHFGKVNLMSVLATVAVGWLIPLIMRYGYVFTLFQFFIPVFTLRIFSFPLFFLGSLLVSILTFLEKLPFYLEYEGFSASYTLISYAVLLAIYGLKINIDRTKKTSIYEKKYSFDF